MDRPLDADFVKRRNIRRAVVAAFTLAIAIAVAAGAPRMLAPSVARDSIRIEQVARGSVEAVITAAGVVLPEIEKVLSTPVDARVLRILRRPGTHVAKGEPIVDLDLSAAKLAVDKLDQDFALKRNQQLQARLELQGRLATLDSQRKAKDLWLQSQQSQLKRRRDLRAQGLVSAEDLQQAELAAAQAAIEMKQMEEDEAHARQATKARLEGMELELATLRSQRAEAARLLSLATTRADRSGVVTWTVSEEGAALRSGDPVARIADLSSFRVEATVSDIHAKRLAVGLPATVKVGDDTLDGVVSNIMPTIRDGIMTFAVALDHSSHEALRSNLRVDVLVVMGRRDGALILRRGPAIDGDGVRQLFLVDGNRAVKAPVRIGLMGFEVCEIVDGLSEGDRVIVSDMRRYEHLSEVRIQQ